MRPTSVPSFGMEPGGRPSKNRLRPRAVERTRHRRLVASERVESRSPTAILEPGALTPPPFFHSQCHGPRHAEQERPEATNHPIVVMAPEPLQGAAVTKAVDEHLLHRVVKLVEQHSSTPAADEEAVHRVRVRFDKPVLRATISNDRTLDHAPTGQQGPG